MAKWRNISGRDTEREQEKFHPYVTDDYIDATTKGDWTVTGELYTQNNSIFIGGGYKFGASNYTVLLNTLDKTNQYVITTAEQGGGVTKFPRYVDSYEYWDKNSDTGQFQPNQTTTLDSVENINFDKNNPRDPRKGYKYTYSIVVGAQGDLRVLNWFLRSATGFTNFYVKMFSNVVVDPIGLLPLWQTHTDSQILNGDCFNADADVVNDIEFNLGNTYYQRDGQLYTFIAYAEEPFQYEAGLLDIGGGVFITYPYVIADGYFIYDTPSFTPIKNISNFFNIEGTIIMSEDVVFGVVTDLSPSDYNYTDVYLWSNGMNNNNRDCQIRTAIYNYNTDELICQGNLFIDNSFDDRIMLRIPNQLIGTIDEITKCRVCFCSNDHSQNGVLRLARERSNDPNDVDFMFQAELSSGGDFPLLFTDLDNLDDNRDNIICEIGFDKTFIQSQKGMTGVALMGGMS